MKLLITIGLVVLSLYSCFQSAKDTFYEDQSHFSKVPNMAKVSIDGYTNDWDTLNYTSIDLFSDELGNMPKPDNLNGLVKIAWNEQALILAISVRDNLVVKDSLNGDIFKGDFLELFICDSVGGKNLLQFIISPFGQEIIWDHRGNRNVLDIKGNIEFSSQITDSGYTIEALIPFDQIGVKPTLNSKPGFQINIVDHDAINDQSKKNVKWFYTKESYYNSFALYPLSLSKTEISQINYNLRAHFEADSLKLKVLYPEAKALDIKLTQSDGEVLYKGEIKNHQAISLPISYSKHLQEILVYSGNNLLGTIIPDFIPSYKMKLRALEDIVRILNYREKINPSEGNGVILIGHSMFRYWHTFEDDLIGFPVINKGFGGSKSSDVNYYYDDLIKPFKPKLIIYFEGANDISAGLEPEMVRNETEKFVQRVKKEHPESIIALVGHPIHRHNKYSIEKESKVKKLDMLHEELAQKYSNVDYINTARCLVNQDNEIYKGIYLPDNSHLNQKGYVYLSKPIRDYLEMNYVP